MKRRNSGINEMSDKGGEEEKGEAIYKVKASPDSNLIMKSRG